jgi:hypothetical protein
MLPPLDSGRLRAANINPATGLATDYLNHYNEIAMSVASLADIPEMRDEVLGWRPVGYPAHFLRTRYADQGLVIAGYIAAPRHVKAQFLAARAALDARLVALQARLAAGDGSPGKLGAEANAIFADIARLGGIINGGRSASLLERSAEQDLVDSFFP